MVYLMKVDSILPAGQEATFNRRRYSTKESRRRQVESSRPEKGKSNVAAELVRQYDNLWDVLGSTVRRIPRKQWTVGAAPARTPARQVCHIIASCEHYATGRSTARNRFGCDADALEGEVPADALPSVDDVLAYIGVARRAVRLWIQGMDERALLGPSPSAKCHQVRGKTPLGHVLYVLRHATVHLGHLRAELRSRGLPYSVFR